MFRKIKVIFFVVFIVHVFISKASDAFQVSSVGSQSSAAEPSFVLDREFDPQTSYLLFEGNINQENLKKLGVTCQPGYEEYIAAVASSSVTNAVPQHEKFIISPITLTIIKKSIENQTIITALNELKTKNKDIFVNVVNSIMNGLFLLQFLDKHTFCMDKLKDVKNIALVYFDEIIPSLSTNPKIINWAMQLFSLSKRVEKLSLNLFSLKEPSHKENLLKEILQQEDTIYQPIIYFEKEYLKLKLNKEIQKQTLDFFDNFIKSLYSNLTVIYDNLISFFNQKEFTINVINLLSHNYKDVILGRSIDNVRSFLIDTILNSGLNYKLENKDLIKSIYKTLYEYCLKNDPEFLSLERFGFDNVVMPKEFQAQCQTKFDLKMQIQELKKSSQAAFDIQSILPSGSGKKKSKKSKKHYIDSSNDTVAAAAVVDLEEDNLSTVEFVQPLVMQHKDYPVEYSPRVLAWQKNSEAALVDQEYVGNKDKFRMRIFQNYKEKLGSEDLAKRTIIRNHVFPYAIDSFILNHSKTIIFEQKDSTFLATIPGFYVLKDDTIKIGFFELAYSIQNKKRIIYHKFFREGDFDLQIEKNLKKEALDMTIAHSFKQEEGWQVERDREKWLIENSEEDNLVKIYPTRNQPNAEVKAYYIILSK